LVEEKQRVLDVVRKYKMMYIPGGEFIMGSPADEIDRHNDETQHQVKVRSFYIGSTEVTQALWLAVMGYIQTKDRGNSQALWKSVAGYTAPWEKGDLPIMNVRWVDCQMFIEKLNLLTGKKYRLPTEAEWEYACRAGTQTPFNTGTLLLNHQASFADYGWPDRRFVMPVGSYAPNKWGLYDMHGNADEWCTYWSGGDKPIEQVKPTSPDSGCQMVRGGSCYSGMNFCRSASRTNAETNLASYELNGFRLVYDVCDADKAQKQDSVEAEREKLSVIDQVEKYKMVNIPGGSFDMGEKNVRVDIKGFRMGATEVTQALWQAVMGSNPSCFRGDNLPVDSVSWYNCQLFIDKLNYMTGKNFRLPTEAEWEYACRAGTSTDYNSGSVLTTDMANFCDYSFRNEKDTIIGIFRKKTIAVGSFSPNAWGLYDMHGNVYEWCQDKNVNKDDYNYGSNGDYTFDRKNDCILRGGSWMSSGFDCRSKSRSLGNALQRGSWSGLRLVLAP